MAVNKSQFRIVDYVESTPENTMVLIGTGLDGPAHIPYQLNDGVNVYDVLGPTPLANAYSQAYKAGVTDIILYRVNGSHSTSTLRFRNADDTFTDVLGFKSVSANDLYNSFASNGDVNQIKVEIDGTMLTVTRSDGTKRAYYLKNYTSSNSLADALNIDYEYGLIEFETTVLSQGFRLDNFSDDTAYTALFEGASTEDNLIINRLDAVNPAIIAELKTRVKVALFGESEEDQANGEPNSLLGYMDFGGIAVADIFYEDDTDIAYLLGLFCQNKSAYSGHGCISVVGTTPLLDTSAEALETKKTNLYNLSPIVKFRSPSGLGSGGTETEVATAVNPLNYVQVVVGDTNIISQISQVPTPFSVAFAYLGTMLSLNYFSNVTNKTLTGVNNLTYEFSKEVIDNLASNGYISIVASVRRGYVPYLAITAVGKDSKSSFRKPHYIRISQHIGRLLNDNLDSLVGSTKQENTMIEVTKTVEELMQVLVDSGAIRGYSVACEYSNYNTVLTVSVAFTPYSDIETVTSVTTLPLGQGVIG